MKRLILFWIVMLIFITFMNSNFSLSEETKFKNSKAEMAKKKYEKEIQKAQKEFEKKIEEAKKKYAKVLDKSLKEEMKKGDLKESVKIQNELDWLKMTNDQIKKILLKNKWINSKGNIITFNENGTLKTGYGKIVPWKVENNKVYITHNEGQYWEEGQLVQGQLNMKTRKNTVYTLTIKK